MPTRTGTWKFVVVLAVSGLGTLASPSWGAEPDARLAKAEAKVDATAATPVGSQEVAADLARELNKSCKCTAYSAASLTAQQAQTGWSWGEILTADRMAQAVGKKTGMPLANATALVVSQRQQGLSWGQIAQADGVKLGKVAKDVDKLAKAFEKSVEKTGKALAKAADKLEDQAEKAAGKAAKAAP